MKEFLRVRCPICGAVPSLPHLAQTQQNKPAHVRLLIFRLGGGNSSPGAGSATGGACHHPSASSLAENAPVGVGQI